MTATSVTCPVRQSVGSSNISAGDRSDTLNDSKACLITRYRDPWRYEIAYASVCLRSYEFLHRSAFVITDLNCPVHNSKHSCNRNEQCRLKKCLNLMRRDPPDVWKVHKYEEREANKSWCSDTSVCNRQILVFNVRFTERLPLW